MENFLNKDSIIKFAFSQSGGLQVVGKITSYDKEFVTIEFDPTNKWNKIYLGSNTSGKMLLNRQFLCSVVLL